MLKKKHLLSYFFYLIPFFLYAQDVQQNFLDSLSGKLITEIRKQGRPKALLTTDKSIFKAGETIWFKGTVINSVSHKIISPGKYLFVDLVNERDSVISNVLLDAAIQKLDSKISLPITIPSGYYWLRAYTRQMAEGDSDNAFVQPIYIASAEGRPATRVNNSTPITKIGDPIIKFYPEGGSIITGANSTVALVVKDTQEKPLAIGGYIKDTRDSVVARFTTDKTGLGKFTLFASSFRRYKAYIDWNGKQISYPLPPFNLFAGQLAVTKQAEGSRTLRVLLEDSIYKKDLATYIIGVSRDSVCYAAIGHGQYEAVVSEQMFPEGISTFYLFDNTGKFLSERSIYIKENNVFITTTLDENTYSKRQKVVLNISVTDRNQHPVPSLISVSVTDSAFTIPAYKTIVPDPNNPDLVNNSNLAFSKDLTDNEIDLNMLFYKNVYSGSNYMVNRSNSSYDSLLFIKGKALDEKNRPAPNKILTLFSNNGNSNFFTDTTDFDGQFSFPVYNYADSTEFAIEARDLNSSTATVKIERESLTFPHFNTPVSSKKTFSVDPSFTTKYRNAYFETPSLDVGKEKLKEVRVKGKRKKEGNYDQSKRVSPSSTIISADQLDERRSVGNILLNVGGLHMLNGFLVINGLTSMKQPDATSEPLLLINGVQAPKAGGVDESPVMSTLNSINPKEIDFIEILKGSEGSNYGLRGGNGVILVNMASNSRDNFSRKANNLQTFSVKGISGTFPFPLINYDDKHLKSAEYFDNRSTIFWIGNILTGSQDPINLNFFTTDVATTFQITVTGITRNGDKIYKTLTFNTR